MAIGNLGKLSVFLDVNMAGFVAGMATAGAQIKGFGGLVTRNSTAIKAMGTKFLVAGAAIAVGLGLAIKAAMDFETGMAKVQTMLKDSEVKYMPGFSKALRKMSVEYGQSLKTLTDGTYDVLSAQMGAAKAMKFMETASKAAVGGFTDTKVAVSAMLTLMKTFNKSFKDAADAADWLHGVVERGRITFEELAGSIGTTAAMAAQAGMTVEDYGTAIAVLTKGGLSAEKSQTALRGILRSVLKVQEDGIDTAKEMGIEWNVDALRGDNFVKTLQSLNGAQIEYLAKLAPNIRGLLGWAVAISDVNEAARDHEALLNRAGLSQKKFEVATNTLRFQLKRLKAAFVDAGITIGSALVPAVKNLIEDLLELAGGIKKYSDEHPGAITNIIKMTAALAAFLFISGAILKTLPGLVIAIKGLGVAFTWLLAHPLIAAFTALVIVFASVATGVGLLTDKLNKYKQAKKDAAQKIFELNTFSEIYNKLLMDAADNLDKFEKGENAATEVLKESIQAMLDAKVAYENGEGGIEDFTAAMVFYTKTLDAANSSGQEQIDALEALGVVTGKGIEQLKLEGELRLLNLSGIEREIEAENIRHGEAIANIKKEFVEDEKYAQILLDLEEKIHNITIKRIKEKEDMYIQMLKTLESSFKSTFSSALQGEVTSFKDFFGRIVDSMRSRWADLVAEMVTNWIKGQFAMQEATGGGSNVGSWLSIIGGLVGLGGVAAGSSLGTSGAGRTFSGQTQIGSSTAFRTMGYASGGMIPATGMYKLHEGEEVKTREPGGSSPVTIVNVLSPDLITAAMASTKGQKVIVNTISTDILKNGITRKTMKGGL